MLNSYNLLNDTRYPACIFHHRGRNLFQHILFVHSALTCIANDALHLVNQHQNVRPTLSKNAKSTCHHGGQLKRPKCLASFFFTFTLDFFFHDMTGTFCPICLSQAKKDIHVIIIIYTLGNSKNIFFCSFSHNSGNSLENPSAISTSSGLSPTSMLPAHLQSWRCLNISTGTNFQQGYPLLFAWN